MTLDASDDGDVVRPIIITFINNTLDTLTCSSQSKTSGHEPVVYGVPLAPGGRASIYADGEGTTGPSGEVVLKDTSGRTYTAKYEHPNGNRATSVVWTVVPSDRRITVMMDNLNHHLATALYQIN